MLKRTLFLGSFCVCLLATSAVFAQKENPTLTEVMASNSKLQAAYSNVSNKEQEIQQSKASSRAINTQLQAELIELKKIYVSELNAQLGNEPNAKRKEAIQQEIDRLKTEPTTR